MRKNLLSFSVVGGSLLFGLSMLFTSCEGTLDDVFGEWDRPSGNGPAYSVTSISLNETSLDLFVEGGTQTATLTASLVGEPGNETVEFSSEDPNIATVDEETGEVTAVGGGEVTIYANIGPTLQAQCKVMVYDRLHNISDGAANIPDGKRWMITGSGANKITIGDMATAVLNGVTITSTAGSCIETNNPGGGSNIILVDGTTNTMDAQGAAKCAAINTDGGPLNILGQTAGTGKLIAKGGASGAGIGGSLDENSKAITILGGVIEATGGENAAGIGSGDCTSNATGNTGGEITILGGEVTATGGANAAGIGTGYSQSGDGGKIPACGIITIDKAVISVTATKGTGAVEPIGRGGKASISEPDPYCGGIIFGTKQMFNGATWTTTPTDGTTYGSLKLAISGDTWTLTPAP